MNNPGERRGNFCHIEHRPLIANVCTENISGITSQGNPLILRYFTLNYCPVLLVFSRLNRRTN